MTRWRAVAAGAVTLVVLAACGSTVPAQRRAAAGKNSEVGELGGVGGAGGGGVEQQSTSAANGTGATAPGRGATAPRTPAGRSAITGGATSGGPAVFGPGVSATTITIGVEYEADDVVNQAAGIQGTSPGDIGAYWRAAIDDINGRGGILGRKLVAEMRPFSASNAASDPDQQQACTYFTEDHKVFAAFLRPSASETFRGCLEQRRTVAVARGGLAYLDEQAFVEFPHFFAAGSLNLSRIARVTPARLFAQGFFSGNHRVGLVTFDEPNFVRASDNAYKPALQSRGMRLTAEARIAEPKSQGDLGAEAAAVSSAVLRFQRSGVDRVVFLEGGGDLALFFMNTAESQGYHPHYGLNSQDAGSVLAQNVPAAQLRGAVGIGWLPGTDVTDANDPPRWPARQRCRDLMAAHGATFPSRYAETNAGLVCDQINVFAAAVTAGAPSITSDTVVEGLNRLSTSVPLAASFAGRFASDSHDGIGAVRDIAFLDACSCFRYTSGDIPI